MSKNYEKNILVYIQTIYVHTQSLWEKKHFGGFKRQNLILQCYYSPCLFTQVRKDIFFCETCFANMEYPDVHHICFPKISDISNRVFYAFL
jgi:hypothetical protein